MPSKPRSDPEKSVCRAVTEWLRAEGNARSTLAGALTVLHVLGGTCPVSDEDVFTPGGQLVGGRGKALRSVLSEFGFDKTFLADGVTTRSTEKFRRLLLVLDYGRPMALLDDTQRRRVLNAAAAPIVREIRNYYARRRLRIVCDRSLSPSAWVEGILQEARERSGGRVEQHLVGAKLEVRHPAADIGRDAAFAGDEQTGRAADFSLGETAYHVTAAPAGSVMRRCQLNLDVGLQPVLIVPRSRLERARGVAQEHGIEDRVTFLSIEDFLTQNILELAQEHRVSPIDMLRQIISIYNERIDSAETDKSLRIEIK